MAKKLQWLLLDANIVIELFRLAIWNQVVERCEIHLPSVVVQESACFEDAAGDPRQIDLSRYQAAGQIHIFETPLSLIQQFLSHFDPLYLEKLDDGEVAALAFLFSQDSTSEPSTWMISSADAIVYRVLGNFGRSAQGLSLEEILSHTGLSRSLSRQYSKSFRKYWSRQGFVEGLGGLGSKH